MILDAWSRRVVGWALRETLEADRVLEALDRALEARALPHGIVHHSDRGLQYCCREYTRKLEAHGFLISMSRKGNPYDNARAESFMKTLKVEEVYLREYRDLEHARECIRKFLDEVYNQRRLHSALGYRSPADFEALTFASLAAGSP